MAELILKIGSISPNPAHYQDGDIIEAFNRRRIRQCHAEHICHVKHVPFNSDGLNPISCLTAKMFEQTALYKFIRVSNKEVKRINLITLEEEIFSDIPNSKNEYIDVPLYLSRRRKHTRHLIFGTIGNEVWYGKYSRRITHIELDRVWDIIETDTPEREINYTLWPLTIAEKKCHLAISVQDFDDIKAGEFTKNEVIQTGIDDKGNPIMEVAKKRIQQVNWRELTLTRTLSDIEDRKIEIDIRPDLELDHTIIKLTQNGNYNKKHRYYR